MKAARAQGGFGGRPKITNAQRLKMEMETGHCSAFDDPEGTVLALREALGQCTP